MVQEHEGRRVGLRSLTEQIDTTTQNGRLIFHIFGRSFSSSVISFASERGAGLSAAARGIKGGRKPVVTSEILRKAQVLMAQGLKVREAAARLKVGKTALYEALAGYEAKPSIARLDARPRSVQAGRGNNPDQGGGASVDV